MKWSVFCAATGRRMKVNQNLGRWFEVGDRADLPYGDKLAAYAALADDYFDQAAYAEFCDRHLGHLDQVMHELVTGDWFDRMLVDTVTSTFPLHEHQQFVAHYRGLLAAWARDQPA